MTAISLGQKGVTNVSVRASAALAAAGAYDTAATVGLSALHCDKLGLSCSYTRGAAGGAAKIKVIVSCDNGATFVPLMMVDPTSYSAGVQTLIVAEFKLPASTGASAETYAVPPIDLSGYSHYQVLAAEYGITATPGTLALLGTQRQAVR